MQVVVVAEEQGALLALAAQVVRAVAELETL
jgi:hypothetical protein